jgi:hypothetical protein
VLRQCIKLFEYYSSSFHSPNAKFLALVWQQF